MKIDYLIFVALFSLLSCENAPKNEPSQTITPPADTVQLVTEVAEIPAVHQPKATHLRYNLARPDNTSKLSSKLTEISGLSLSPDGQTLVAINDEEGKIFYLNKENGEIVKTQKFGKGADYEGIETVGNEVYVVESNGTLQRLKKIDKEKPDNKEYDTPLNSKYDVEGLAYDSKNNRLLLACKGKPGDADELRGSRAIYAFNLENHELEEKPVFVVNRKAIGDYFAADNISEKLISLLGPEYATDAFAPSGIAIHPETSDICIVSSVGKLFIILHPDGRVLHMEKLESSIFKQPEGICFDKNGTLYISTEGKGGKAKLYQFLQN